MFRNKPLFDAQMCVDGGVASSARQVLVFSVGDVLSGPVVSVLLCQTKVDKEELTTKKKHKRGKEVEPGQIIPTNPVI